MPISDAARRCYETDGMTVREVAQVIGRSYEQTWLLLIQAGTKFRRRVVR